MDGSLGGVVQAVTEDEVNRLLVPTVAGDVDGIVDSRVETFNCPSSFLDESLIERGKRGENSYTLLTSNYILFEGEFNGGTFFFFFLNLYYLHVTRHYLGSFIQIVGYRGESDGISS